MKRPVPDCPGYYYELREIPGHDNCADIEIWADDGKTSIGIGIASPDWDEAAEGAKITAKAHAGVRRTLAQFDASTLKRKH